MSSIAHRSHNTLPSTTPETTPTKDRRTFLKVGAGVLAGAIVAGGGALGFNHIRSDNNAERPGGSTEPGVSGPAVPGQTGEHAKTDTTTHDQTGDTSTSTTHDQGSETKTNTSETVYTGPSIAEMKAMSVAEFLQLPDADRLHYQSSIASYQTIAERAKQQNYEHDNPHVTWSIPSENDSAKIIEGNNLTDLQYATEAIFTIDNTGLHMDHDNMNKFISADYANTGEDAATSQVLQHIIQIQDASTDRGNMTDDATVLNEKPAHTVTINGHSYLVKEMTIVDSTGDKVGQRYRWQPYINADGQQAGKWIMDRFEVIRAAE